MVKYTREAYKKEVFAAAKRLGLPTGGDVEATLVHHFENEIESWIAEYGEPATLTELADLLAGFLGMKFEEIRSDADLADLIRRIPPDKELYMATVASELDDNTDAITIQRSNHKSWELPFLAVINCRDWHQSRRFFSKWHEICHRLLEGNQLRFAFRRTLSKENNKDPYEQLIDKIAGALAFYPGMFKPVFSQEYSRFGKLNFSVVDKVQNSVAPDASNIATVIACVNACPSATWYVQCGMGYKREEQRFLKSDRGQLQLKTGSGPQKQLRVLERVTSPTALALGISIFPNMRVPELSTVAEAFRDPSGRTFSGIENLEIWETSVDGPIGYGKIEVEAVRYDDKVSAFIRLVSTDGIHALEVPSVIKPY